MKAAPFIALGAAGAARALLRDGDSRRKAAPVADAHVAAVASSAGPMPCGVSQITDHGFKRIDFGDHWVIQRDSLRKAFGDAIEGVLGSITRTPKLDAHCAIEWLESWVQIVESAGAGPLGDKLLGQRFDLPEAVGGPVRAPSESDVPDRLRAVQEELTRARATVLGVLPRQLPGELYGRMGPVMRATANLANAMDSQITIDFSTGYPTFGDLVKGEAKDVATGIADSTGFVVESVLGPVAGAAIAASLGVLASSLAPYLILGGASYYVYRRGL